MIRSFSTRTIAAAALFAVLAVPTLVTAQVFTAIPYLADRTKFCDTLRRLPALPRRDSYEAGRQYEAAKVFCWVLGGAAADFAAGLATQR